MYDDVVKRLFARKIETMNRTVDRMPTGIKKAVNREKVRRMENRVWAYDRATDPEVRLAALRDCHVLQAELDRILFSRLKGVC